MTKSACIAVASLLLLVGSVIAVTPTPNDTASVTARGQATIDRSLAWLKAQQKPDGGWQKENEPPAMTALVLRAMLQSGKADAQTPEIKKGFVKLLSYQLNNGGIFKDLLGTYNTAIAITALTAPNDPKYKEPLERAWEDLKSLQWTDAIQGLPNGGKPEEKNPNLAGWDN